MDIFSKTTRSDSISRKMEIIILAIYISFFIVCILIVVLYSIYLDAGLL